MQDELNMLATSSTNQSSRRRRLAIALVAAAVSLPILSGCGRLSENFQKGYVLPEGALEQIPMGASQDQVLIVLGTPSTVATVSGEAFYYISQKTERKIAFMNQNVVDQRVIAVYFDKNRRVERLANYGIKDGKVFDFVSKTTQTGGDDFSYLTYLFKIIRPLDN
jgi:outer membrane protein assembly factor BamE (lipoprotein component of BamABCDE complex)